MTSIIPLPYRWLALALLVSAFGALCWFKGEVHGEAKLTAYQLAESQATVKAQAAAAAITRAQQQRKDDALAQATQRAQRAEAAASSARAAGDGLRHDLTQARSDLSRATVDAVRKYAATLSAVFDECSAEVERLAKAADGHASDSLTYQQAWPK